MRVLRCALVVILAGAAFSLSPAACDKEADKNKAVVKAFLGVEVEKGSKVDQADLLTEDVVITLSPSRQKDGDGSHVIRGLDQLGKVRGEHQKEYEILETEIEAMVAEGNTVAVYSTIKVKFHETGKEVTVPRMTFFQLEDGKIKSVAVLVDFLHLKHQEAIK